MERIYAFPLLRLLDDDTALKVNIKHATHFSRRLTLSQQLHHVITALRELWNVRDTLNFDLPAGELKGCRFGLQAMQDLVDQPGCSSFFQSTSEEIIYKIFVAMRSPDSSKQMSEFMRWATDT